MVIGLVAITPGAGFVPVWASAIIGALASPICYMMVSVVKHKLGYDDALDAFGCHGIGGIFGGLMTGVFGLKSVNSALRWNGLIGGSVHLFAAQVIAILVTIAVAVVGTLICIGIVKLITPLRVSDKEEAVGLDRSEHNEKAYPSFNGLD
jgi:Amt family ammonium transporter